MGKKKSRAHQVSKGERKSVARKTLLAVRRDRSYSEKISFITKHWAKGENPWITIKNPDKKQTNMKYIRVRTNDVWGYPRPAQIKMRSE